LQHLNAGGAVLGIAPYESLIHLPTGSLVWGVDPVSGYAQVLELGGSKNSKVHFNNNPTRSNTTSTDASSQRSEHGDVEAAFHEGVMKGRQGPENPTWKARWKGTGNPQKWVIAASVIVAIMTIIALVFLWIFSESKKMVRGGILGGFTILPMCVVFGMWAGGQDTVKILIAGTSVLVYGILLSAQLDVLLTF
jgi:hypothetical protein